MFKLNACGLDVTSPLVRAQILLNAHNSLSAKMLHWKEEELDAAEIQYVHDCPYALRTKKSLSMSFLLKEGIYIMSMVKYIFNFQRTR
jgi:hypothetical protein